MNAVEANLAEALKTGVETRLACERILVPVDFTHASVAALKHAAALALRDRSSLCLLHVLDGVDESLDQNLFYSVADLRRQAEQKLAQLARFFVPTAVSVRVLVYVGPPVAQIVESAAALQCDLIILCRHRRPFWQRLLGRSTTEEIAERANCHIVLMHTPHAHRLEPSYWQALDKDAEESP